MMKIRSYIIVFTTLLLTYNTNAQEKLHYFLNTSDSLIGVKDENGHTIVPAKYKWVDAELDKTIDDSIIIFVTKDNNPDATSRSYGDAYDRTGKFLFHPLFFDNGPDYISEGLIRCVDNGKAGFVNEKGRIVIKPRWDWVTEFNYGYAWVCNGCYFDRTADMEHPPLKFKELSQKGYINKTGQIINPTAKPGHPKDLRIDSVTFLPYPFRYNAYEQHLVDTLNSLGIISKIYLTNVYGSDAPLQFELLERPTYNAPYYKLQGYSSANGTYSIEDRFEFLVDKAGNLFYYDDFEEIRLPYGEWVRKELLESIEFFKTHPDAPNKFDAERYLSEIN